MTQFTSKAPDVKHDLLVRADDARLGHVYYHQVIWTIACDPCRGSGAHRGASCAACDGQGFTERKVRYEVKLPPNTRELQQLRLAGCGHESTGPTEQVGDLILTIRFFGSGRAYQALPVAQPVRKRGGNELPGSKSVLPGSKTRALR